MRKAAILALLTVLALPAFAAEEKADKKTEKKEGGAIAAAGAGNEKRAAPQAPMSTCRS